MHLFGFLVKTRKFGGMVTMDMAVGRIGKTLYCLVLKQF